MVILYEIVRLLALFCEVADLAAHITHYPSCQVFKEKQSSQDSGFHLPFPEQGGHCHRSVSFAAVLAPGPCALVLTKTGPGFLFAVTVLVPLFPDVAHGR